MASTSFGKGNCGFQAHTINGPVHVEYHPPLQRAETPPRPSAAIPFPRDVDFVERGTILDEVHRRHAVAGSWVALVGLGGVGKSQLAIEYAYRTRERSAVTWVLWAHASNAVRFEQSYREIADRVEIPERQDPKANIFKLVHDWLCSSKNQWLLVLDNVDDAHFLFDAPIVQQDEETNLRITSKPLRFYIPHSERGSVLITTRNQDAALQLAERRDIISVQPMNDAQASALFKRKLEEDEDPISINELAAALEYMPLAIVQAAAYISKRVPRSSVRQYLDEFRKSEHKRTSLLIRNERQLRRDREAKNSILVTWQISFEHIQLTRPSAADLLSLMSFFDRQGIPAALLRGRGAQTDASEQQQQQEANNPPSGEDSDTMSQSSEGDDKFEDDVVTLRNFCFISVERDSGNFRMHALVQLATRQWLKVHNQLEKWKQQSISNLYAVFPTDADSNWERCQVLFPHAKLAAGQQPQGASSLKKWAALLYYAASYAANAGDIVNAKALAIQSTDTRKTELGPDHRDTLWGMIMMAKTYSLEGQYTKAEALEVEVVETFQKKLGVDHLDTVATMGNLASTYNNQGRWEEAEALEVKVVEISKSKLGVDHPETLTSMVNLASTYSKQGRWREAEALEAKVLEIREGKLGVDHPDTLISMNNLSATYREQGRWEDAEMLDLHVLEARKKKFGPDHPYTLVSMGNLASTYGHQGRLSEAEALEMKRMEICEKKFGTDYPDTLTSMNNLSVTYKEQERWEDAEKLDLHVLEARKRKFGLDHPHTLASMGNLASTYSHQERWKEAEALEVEVVKISKSKLGVDHPETLISMGNLASTYSYQGRWKEAEALEVEVVEISKRKLGVGHPDTLASMDNLAVTFREQERWEEARALEEEARKVCKDKLSLDYPDMLKNTCIQALIYMDQRRWGEAEALMEEVVEACKNKLGVDHLTTLANIDILSRIRREEAEALRAETTDPSVANHHSTLSTGNNLVDIGESRDRGTEVVGLGSIPRGNDQDKSDSSNKQLLARKSILTDSLDCIDTEQVSPVSKRRRLL
ncbi:TPR-like protein [Periconia macrospinosa]|uniref:TPR-like protein n=1 Tax=Periconia macrospinosa TaxID=97972 RepID=A0A2V1DVD2_9PLEO|nr:TPR-like protein [Periconia macrospinosa]